MVHLVGTMQPNLTCKKHFQMDFLSIFQFLYDKFKKSID